MGINNQKSPIELCRFYNGEEECPDHGDGVFFRQLWFAEKTFVRSCSPDRHYEQRDAVDFVAAEISTWMPYKKVDALAEYLQWFPSFRDEMMRIYG